MDKKNDIGFFSFFLGLVAAVLGVGILVWAAKSDVSKGVAVWSVLFSWAVIGYGVWKMNLWKTLSFWLLIYTFVWGFLGEVPCIKIQETIRNLYFHVTMWFAMLFLLLASVIFSVKFLSSEKLEDDIISAAFAQAGMIFGVIGLLTGMLWAEFAWGKFWSNDPKQIYAAIGLLLYLAYFILRGALADDIKKARISAVFNVFAFPSMIVLFYVLPRMVGDSLHPGAEGNPGLNSQDISNDMKLVFYPAIIGWTLLGTWIASIKIRINKLELKWINS
jgi:heme exporter protein C